MRRRLGRLGRPARLAGPFPFLAPSPVRHALPPAPPVSGGRARGFWPAARPVPGLLEDLVVRWWAVVAPIRTSLTFDRQLDRFARLRASRYNAASLRTYGNRFKAAIANYTRYLEDPAAFRAAGSRGLRTKGPDKPVKKAKQTRRTTGGPETGPAPEKVAGLSSDLVQYPFPLRSGVLIYVSLPRDLRRSEAQRIAAFVASLAIDPVPELGTGKSEGS